MNLELQFTLVHLWPHHFDFSVEWFTGNKDEQIGIGISPVDEQYMQPYLYMNPWPFNDKLTETDIPIGNWHKDGWKGVKVEWSDLQKLSSLETAEKITTIFEMVKRNFE